jgi:hypothetical protein
MMRGKFAIANRVNSLSFFTRHPLVYFTLHATRPQWIVTSVKKPHILRKAAVIPIRGTSQIEKLGFAAQQNRPALGRDGSMLLKK